MWLETGEGDIFDATNNTYIQKNRGNNNTITGDISSSKIDINSLLDIIKTIQNQLTESQKQISSLIEIIKNIGKTYEK